jgi:hypothetical protein
MGMNTLPAIKSAQFSSHETAPALLGEPGISLGSVRRDYVLAPGWEECCFMAVSACGLPLLYGWAAGEIPLLVAMLGALSVAYPLLRLMAFPMRLMFADSGCVLVYPFGRLHMIPYPAIQALSGGVIEFDGRRLWLWWSPSISLNEHHPEVGQLLGRLGIAVGEASRSLVPRSLALWCVALSLWAIGTLACFA